MLRGEDVLAVDVLAVEKIEGEELLEAAEGDLVAKEERAAGAKVDVVAPERFGSAPGVRLDRLNHARAFVGVAVVGRRGDRADHGEHERGQGRSTEPHVYPNGWLPFIEPVPRSGYR